MNSVRTENTAPTYFLNCNLGGHFLLFIPIFLRLNVVPFLRYRSRKKDFHFYQGRKQPSALCKSVFIVLPENLINAYSENDCF